MKSWSAQRAFIIRRSRLGMITRPLDRKLAVAALTELARLEKLS